MKNLTNRQDLGFFHIYKENIKTSNELFSLKFVRFHLLNFILSKKNSHLNYINQIIFVKA